MKKFLEHLLGIDVIKEEMQETAQKLKSERDMLDSLELELSLREESIAKEKERVDAEIEVERLKLLEQTDPKAAATAKGEAYIAVIDTQVNADNIRNGFFELDWNNEFIEQLIDAGYKGESNEQIVDQWFRTVVTQMLQEEGQTADRDMGYINIIPMDDGKSEVS